MFSHIKETQDLIGKRIECSIGEPWDFKSEAGKNKIKGKIIAISNDKDAKENIKDWVLCKISPFELSGITINMVYVKNRHIGFSLFDDLTADKEAICNFSYNKFGKKLTIDIIRKTEKKKDYKNFGGLIGSIRVVK